MVITKNKTIKENFSVMVGGKVLHHQKRLQILGNIINDELTWEDHVKINVIPALANRAHTLKMTTQYMDKKFKVQYATAIFKGKLTFAIDAWGGVCKTLMEKVQKIQDRVAKSTLGQSGEKMSRSQRLKVLGWLTVEQEAKVSTMKFVHKILNKGVPEELALKMPPNLNITRFKKAKKLATKPKSLAKNKHTLSTFRSRAYFFNTLPNRITEIEDHKTFTKWVKVFLSTPNKVPNIIPKRTPQQCTNHARNGAARTKPNPSD